MISGNCNRSPQYTTMGQPLHTLNNRHPLVSQSLHHQQQQQPHVLFMAGGSVRGIPQASRGYSMMSPAPPVHPIAVQCNMTQNFGYGHVYAPNSSPNIFHQQRHYYHQQPMEQPQLIHQRPQLHSHHHHNHHFHPLENRQPQPPQAHFNHQQYMTPPPEPIATVTPTSGFINGIKNMVKGIIQPLNCDFYNDHHKHYNPKFRNNYMRDMSSELDVTYFPQRNEPHLQVLSEGLKGKTTVVPPVSKPSEVAAQSQTPNYIKGVMAIFTSEDFPELPAPRRSRSTTPARTEKPAEQVVKGQKEATPSRKNQSVASAPQPAIQPAPIPAMPRSPSSCPARKSVCFEICNMKKPTGRRPTFGGRMKIVPPPFTLNKCQSPVQESPVKSSSSDVESDADENSFVMLPNKAIESCLTSVCFNRPQRQRNLSECSDDSFVVFYAEDADTEIEYVDDDDDEDDDNSTEDDDSDDDDDEDCFDTDSEAESENGDKSETGIDVVDCSPGMIKRIETDRIKCPAATTDLLYTDLDLHCPRAEHVQLDSGFDEKKVTFNEQPEVHVMHAWNYAYRAARKGHWEDVARDRSRFQKRIERTAVHINPILTPEHREKIYRTRFAAPDNDDVQQQNDNRLETRSQIPADSSHDNDNQTKVDDTPLLC